jgi:hypothetical protein
MCCGSEKTQREYRRQLYLFESLGGNISSIMIRQNRFHIPHLESRIRLTPKSEIDLYCIWQQSVNLLSFVNYKVKRNK